MSPEFLRRTAPDVLLAAGAVVAGVTATWRSWSGASGWVSAGIVVAAGLALGLCRTRPVPVFGWQALSLLLADHVAPIAANVPQTALLVVLGFLAARTSWPATAVAAAVACGASAVNLADPGVGLPAWWQAAGALLGFVVAPVAVGRYASAVLAAAGVARERERETAEHREVALRAARLAERTRIARDLHDIVAHHVGAMVLRASAARYAGAPPPVAEVLGDIRETGTRVLSDLRGLLAVLRDPDALAEPGGAGDAAGEMAAAVERAVAAGLVVDADIDPAVAGEPAALGAAATRVVQEGLTNVLKHAGPGTAVRVAVAVAAGEVAVTVGNGEPRGPSRALPSAGYGLAGVRERAALLGGTCEAGPSGDGGWRLAVRIPRGGDT